MIPKVIHYCWFGRGEKPELLKHCIESWKKHCPDYEIKEWNEDNFDVNMFPFTADAYKAKKWAFVSDVARVWVVYNYGGIYLDTDVELKRSIDDLLVYDGWFASDNLLYVNTGLGFGGIKGNRIVGALLDDYKSRKFDLNLKVVNTSVNTEVIKSITHYEFWDKTRVFENNLIIGFNCEYSSYAKHYYTLTWKDDEDGKARRIDAKRIGEKSSFWKRFKWKIVVKVQNPKMTKYCQTHDNLFSKLYMFYAYDVAVNGLKAISNFIKGQIQKRKH